MESKKAYIHHARAIPAPNGQGYCSRGMRLFATRHNLDWEDFLLNGIEVDKLKLIDDDMVRALILEAEKDG